MCTMHEYDRSRMDGIFAIRLLYMYLLCFLTCTHMYMSYTLYICINIYYVHVTRCQSFTVKLSGILAEPLI